MRQTTMSRQGLRVLRDDAAWHLSDMAHREGKGLPLTDGERDSRKDLRTAVEEATTRLETTEGPDPDPEGADSPS